MSDLIKPFSIQVSEKESDSDKKVMVDFGYFRTENAKVAIPIESEDDVKKRGRPPKKKSEPAVYVPVDSNGCPTKLSALETNEPYINTYTETNYLLKNAIGQIDLLASEIKQDMDAVRESKTLKNKYNYITEMTTTTSSLLGTKISAIRELNSTISHSHDLDLKRAKELKLSAAAEQTDDKTIMDMYSAFVNTPVGVYGGPGQLGPSVQEMTLMSNMDSMIRTDIMSQGVDIGYNQYMNNLTPEQNRMRLEDNPNIETVVVFNQDSGQRYFDVIDKTTGMSVPNYARPDSFLLDNTTIDVNRQIARNIDIDRTFPLILVGQNSNMSEY